MSSDRDVTQHDKQVLMQIFNDDFDSEESNPQDIRPTADEDETVKHSRALELEGVTAAEGGDIDLALDLLTQAINVSPHWASAYNNRAQALRLKGDEVGALSDLAKAIELSQEQGTVACQAFTQRGLLRKKDGDDEGAKEDLTKAAKLGGRFAKQMLVAMNPYAALCNQMLGQVFQKLRTGEEGDSPRE